MDQVNVICMDITNVIREGQLLKANFWILTIALTFCATIRCLLSSRGLQARSRGPTSPKTSSFSICSNPLYMKPQAQSLLSVLQPTLYTTPSSQFPHYPIWSSFNMFSAPPNQGNSDLPGRLAAPYYSPKPPLAPAKTPPTHPRLISPTKIFSWPHSQHHF